MEASCYCTGKATFCDVIDETVQAGPRRWVLGQQHDSSDYCTIPALCRHDACRAFLRAQPDDGRPRGQRRRRGLQDGNRRRHRRPHHGHRVRHARRPRPGGAAAGQHARHRRRGRLPRSRRGPCTPPASRRWPKAATWPPTRSSASSSTPTAGRCTTTPPTSGSPTSPPPRCARNASSRPGRS